MLESSPVDKELIAKYPLDGWLDFLRDKLPAPEQHPENLPTNDLQSATSLLLVALMGHKAAKRLGTKMAVTISR